MVQFCGILPSKSCKGILTSTFEIPPDVYLLPLQGSIAKQQISSNELLQSSGLNRILQLLCLLKVMLLSDMLYFFYKEIMSKIICRVFYVIPFIV
jgi:hypothetical protein